ncbi:MAG: hypothetical protein ACLQKA_13610 [Bryobacteraceae bacterium]
MLTVRIVVAWVILSALVRGQTPNTKYYRVDATVDDIGNGFLQWEDSLPAAQSKVFGAKTYLLIPYLDIYKDGKSVYYCGDGKTNAALLQKFDGVSIGGGKAPLRPSLQQAIDMIPALRAKRNELLAYKGLTLVSVTYLKWSRCKEQNDALQELRKRTAAANIRIIEVLLHQ